MGETVATAEQVLHLQDVMLMQQARGLDLADRAVRMQTRDRLQKLFLRLQAVIAPPLTLEIGAHAAEFSRRMAGAGAVAHAFEANPYAHAEYAQAILDGAPGVQYHQAAISDVDGETEFHIKTSRAGRPQKKRAGNNSLLRRSADRYQYETVTVESRRLDSFLAAEGLEGLQFSAWIDVEGALGRVTAGFGSALDRCMSLIVEVEEAEYWAGQMLALDAMRYFVGQGLVPVARDFEAVHQYNIVFLRPDVLARAVVRAELMRHFAG